MQIVEGLTIFHIIAAILGIILFLTALILLIRSAVKTNTYPKPLIVCLVIGGMLEVFPVTGKFEAGSLLNDITTLSEKIEKEPSIQKRRELQIQLNQKKQIVENWGFKSSETHLKLKRAEDAIKR